MDIIPVRNVQEMRKVFVAGAMLHTVHHLYFDSRDEITRMPVYKDKDLGIEPIVKSDRRGFYTRRKESGYMQSVCPWPRPITLVFNKNGSITSMQSEGNGKPWTPLRTYAAVKSFVYSSVEYKGTRYVIRTVKLRPGDVVSYRIAGSSLYNDLHFKLTVKKKLTAKAGDVDDTIFQYVDDVDLITLSDEKLSEYLHKNQ